MNFPLNSQTYTFLKNETSFGKKVLYLFSTGTGEKNDLYKGLKITIEISTRKT
jgi:hypothetical protein